MASDEDGRSWIVGFTLRPTHPRGMLTPKGIEFPLAVRAPDGGEQFTKVQGSIASAETRDRTNGSLLKQTTFLRTGS